MFHVQKSSNNWKENAYRSHHKYHNFGDMFFMTVIFWSVICISDVMVATCYLCSELIDDWCNLVDLTVLHQISASYSMSKILWVNLLTSFFTEEVASKVYGFPKTTRLKERSRAAKTSLMKWLHICAQCRFQEDLEHLEEFDNWCQQNFEERRNNAWQKNMNERKFWKCLSNLKLTSWN